MLGEKAHQARRAELAAQAVQGPARQGDAQPVHRVADTADDAEARSHIRRVRDRLGEDPRDEDGRGDHPGICVTPLSILPAKEPADRNRFRRDDVHDDTVDDEEAPEEYSR